MSGFHNSRGHDLQLPFPGCIGMMINMFDLSASMTGTKLLTDRAHRDDSPVRRSKSGTKKVTHPIGGSYVDDKQVDSERKRRSSSQKSGATPVKMLIAEEMSKETEPRRNAPSIVARLMGLDDDMPAQQPVVAASKRNLHEDCPRSYLPCHQEQVLRTVMQHEVQQSDCEDIEFKDIHEVCQQPSRVGITKDQYLQWGHCKANNSDKRMALVRQKFMEAKRLATDEKLLHSQEFHDALEVLSSNKDLFVKFLEEPRSLYSQQVNDFEAVSPLLPARRITILKPSKTAESKLIKRQHYRTVDDRRCESNKPQWNSNFSNLKVERSSQPTRIVVLKPGNMKPHGRKINITHPTSPELLEQSCLFGDSEDSDDKESRHIRKDFTKEMLEISNFHRRDESLLSSVYSNGYGGDESSFYRSESEYIEEDGDCFSNSEAVTPTVRHSWDYSNRFGSPYSISSFSRASYSPESSVIKEAKKRLSERLALVASSGIKQEVNLRRSSSTLGEMLAVHDIKKQENTNGQPSGSKPYVQENELRPPASSLSSSRAKDAEGDGAIINLSRSKSVPVSSSIYEDIGLKVEASSPHITKTITSKEVTKPQKGKLSFRGRVSSLLFSRNKKKNYHAEEHVSPPRKKEKPDSQQLLSDSVKMQSGDILSAVDGKYELLTQDFPVESSQNSDEGSRTICPKPVIVATREEPRMYDNLCDDDKLRTYDTSSAKQDQPSPTSVLDAWFQDEGNDCAPPSSESDTGQLKQLSKSSTVDSVARILSWDDSHLNLSSSKVSSSCSPLSESSENENITLIQKLLLLSGLQTSNTLFADWHSLDSPLDPMLFDKFCNDKDEESMCREKTTNMRLLFDCVNSALLEIGTTAFLSAYPWTKSSLAPQKDVHLHTKSLLDMSSLVMNWLSGRLWAPAVSGNSNQMVDTILERDVRGKAWPESMKLEVEELSKEICGEVLNDLVVDALVDFTGVR